MKVAVTGATGLVGQQVARAAVERGHRVLALLRPGPLRPGWDRHLADLRDAAALTHRRVDLLDASRLAAALEGCDALVHCAAVYAYGPGHAAEVDRVNIEGTRVVVEAAAAAGVRRLVVTSSSVTRGSSPLPLARTEDDRLGSEPTPVYYASKVAQEEMALRAADEHGVGVVLALPTVVLGGPFARVGPSNAIVLRYLLDPTRSTFPGGCNVVDARDVGAGHVVLLEQGRAGDRYLLGGEDVLWRTLHRHVARLAGLPGPFAEVPAGIALALSAAAEAWASVTDSEPLSTVDEAATVGRHYWYSSARATALGYTARPAEEAVAASLAWLLATDALPRWVREGLRVAPQVRAARALVPRPLEPSDAAGPSRVRGPRRRPPRPPPRPR